MARQYFFMFIIVEHTFDSYENRIGSARYEKSIGTVDTEDDAKEYIEQKMKNEKQYQGWDGCKYPHYTYKKIQKLSLN